MRAFKWREASVGDKNVTAVGTVSEHVMVLRSMLAGLGPADLRAIAEDYKHAIRAALPDGAGITAFDEVDGTDDLQAVQDAVASVDLTGIVTAYLHVHDDRPARSATG